jgi:hypothetical protein
MLDSIPPTEAFFQIDHSTFHCNLPSSDQQIGLRTFGFEFSVSAGDGTATRSRRADLGLGLRLRG